MIAYLLLPHGFKPPFQVIRFAPAADVESGLRTLVASTEANLPRTSAAGGRWLPLYKLLREPKRELIFEGPHVPPQELYVPQRWFDETLGKVR